VGTIFKRVGTRGRISYTARVRRQGEPHQAVTFYRKADAVKWIEEQEIAIQRRRHLGSKKKGRKASA